MASKEEFVEFVSEQMKGAGDIRYRKMFGEYAIYCDDKVVALVCDDQLFVKPTDVGRDFIKDPEEAPPYPGAKNYFLIKQQLEDHEWLSGLIRRTAQSLPEPKPKKKK